MRLFQCLVVDEGPMVKKILENYIADVPYLELKTPSEDMLEVIFSIDVFLMLLNKIHAGEYNKADIAPKSDLKQPTLSSSIFVKSDKKIVKLNLNEILYVEAYGNYIKIFADKMILTPLSLSDFYKFLSDDFVRVHKSYIVNFYHLKLIEGNQIALANGEKLPIGRFYRRNVQDKIAKYIGN